MQGAGEMGLVEGRGGGERVCVHVRAREGRETVFIWVPGHVGIRGNSAADSAAKDALDGNISVELIPFSDLKPCTNKYILEMWQSEWDEFPVLGKTEKKKL